MRNERAVSPVGILVGLLVIVVSFVFIVAALPAPYALAGFPLVVPASLQLPAAVITLIVGAVVVWVV